MLDEHLDYAKNITLSLENFFKGMTESKKEEQKRNTNQEGEEVKVCVGSIRKKPGRNVFEGRYYINKKQRSVYGKSFDEVKEKLLEIYNNKFLLGSSIKTFYSWLDEWFEVYKKPNLKPSSLNNITYCIKHYIKPFFKDLPLNMITPQEVQSAVNKITASRMRKYTFDIYRASLRQAYKVKLITENIAELLEPVKHTTKIGKPFTLEQREKLELYLNQDKFKCFKLYLLTGCRPQEGLELKWTDLDYDANLIHIPGTKTDDAERYIPFFEDFKEYLKSLDQKSETILGIGAGSIKKRLEELRAKVGFNFNTYTFRHTFATICMEKGIEMKVIQKWLGHTDIKTTSKYYVHVLSDFEREQAEKLKN